MVKVGGIEIWHGSQSTIRLESGAVVFIDPYKLSGSQPKADVILITHDHYDHCEPASIGKIRKEGTAIIGPESCAPKVDGLKVLKPGDSVEEKGVRIEAVHAYNTNKPFHGQGKCLGFVVAIAGRRIYHAGDTDRIPEMKNLRNIDTALLPVGGTYTMTAEEAAAAVNEDIKPKVAIPMHYGTVIGSMADAEKFKKLCKCEVVVL